MLCDQWCGTSVHYDPKDGKIHNDRDNKVHNCSQAERAREFEGYYNMIQIKMVREELNNILYCVAKVQEATNALDKRLDWQEQQNKPWAERFVKRKQKGRDRNRKNVPIATVATNGGPVIRVASELLKP